MSLPRYANYKDSGVAWLGDVPAHWSVSKVKTVIKAIDSGVSVNAVDTPAAEGSVGVLKTSCVYDGTFRFEENKAVLEDELSRVACAVEKDTVIVSRMNTPALVGAAGLVKESRPNIYLPDRLWQIRFQNCAPSFVHYWTLSPIYRYQVEIACAGTSSSMQNLGQDQFKSFWIPLPALEEQSAIATFLDRETGKIDALIAEQEKLLTLLAEKRQATISHAVTRGLNPNAQMKDSGVPWLGEVPVHWSVKSLKHVISGSKAGPFGSAITKDMYVNEGYRVYGQEQVIPADFSKGNYFISEDKYLELQQYGVAPGDILISCVGTFGKIAIVPKDVHPGVINPRLIRLRVGGDVSADFLVTVLRSSVAFEQFSLLSRGGTMDVINIGTLSSIDLAIPPYEEQVEIVCFVAHEAAKLDALKEAAECAIVLLKERRSALIAAAVTGKIALHEAIEVAS